MKEVLRNVPFMITLKYNDEDFSEEEIEEALENELIDGFEYYFGFPYPPNASVFVDVKEFRKLPGTSTEYPAYEGICDVDIDIDLDLEGIVNTEI